MEGSRAVDDAAEGVDDDATAAAVVVVVVDVAVAVVDVVVDGADARGSGGNAFINCSLCRPSMPCTLRCTCQSEICHISTYSARIGDMPVRVVDVSEPVVCAARLHVLVMRTAR